MPIICSYAKIFMNACSFLSGTFLKEVVTMPKINLIVNARHEKDGRAFPTWEDGRLFGIDPILDVWKAAALKAGFKYSLHLSQLRKNCNVIKCRWLVVPG